VLRERARVLAEQAPPFAQPPSAPPAFGMREAPWASHNAAVAPAGPSSAGASDQAKRMPASSSPPSAGTSGPVPEVPRGFWREASGPKKLIVLLMPFALASTFWVIWDDEGADVGPSPTPKTSVLVAVTTPPSASAEVGVGLRPRLATTPPAPPSASARQVTAAAAEAAAAPSAEAPSAATPSAATPSAATPSAATPSAATPSAAASAAARPDAAVTGATKPLADANGFSPRTALNAVFLGDWGDATKQYAALASANPDNEAFRLAARLTADHAVRRP